MNPENLLSTSLLLQAYGPPHTRNMPGVPELAYQHPTSTHSLRRRTGELLIKIGTRLASVDQPKVQWVEEMT